MEKKEASKRRQWFSELHSTRPLQLLVLSLIVAVAAPIIGAHFYTGEIIWPLVIGGYLSAAPAFSTAPFLDRHSRLQDEARQSQAERRRGTPRPPQEQDPRGLRAQKRCRRP